MLEITEGVLKGFLLLDSLLRGFLEFFESVAAVHSRPQCEKVSKRPALLVEQFGVFVAACERSPLIQQFGQRYCGSRLQYRERPLVPGRRTDDRTVPLKTGVGVELRRHVTQPRRQPVRIQAYLGGQILGSTDAKLA